MGSVNTMLQANNTTRIARGEYDAKRMLQSSGNSRAAAEQTLSDFTRSLNNNLRMEGAGKEYGEAMRQLTAELDAGVNKKANSDMDTAQRLGALLAQSSALGVGGASVELLNETVKLHNALIDGTVNDTMARAAHAQGERAAQLIDNAANQADLSRTFGNFDYTVHIAPKAMKHRFAKLVGVAAATYFGGPQAGEAVANMAVGEWQAENGNFAGAAQSFDSAIRNGVAGYQTWSSLQGGSGPKTWGGALTAGGNSNQAKINWGGIDSESIGSDYGWFRPEYGRV